MSRKIEVQIVGDSSSLHRALGSATSGTSRLGSAFGHVARLAAGLGGILAGVEVLKFGKEAVQAAAQVQKSTEAIRADYGKAGEEVIRFGERAANAFGISNQASTAFSAQIGITAKNIGLTHDAAARMDIGLQKLAGSIGLIKGQDPSSVFNTLTLALAGNTRGLKALGVVITPIAEKQMLLREGIHKSVADLTAAQKATLIYNIATSKLGALQAQARAHSADFADQMIILRARLANLADSIGAKVLPVVSNLVGLISKVAAAPNFTVGVTIVAKGVEHTAESIAGAIQHAFEGSTSKTVAIRAPSGKLIGFSGGTFSKGIIQNLQSGLEHANWTKIGAQVGASLGKAIRITAGTASRIVNNIADGIAANSGKIASVMAKIGLLMALNMVGDLIDPQFWIDNWKIAATLAVNAALLAFAPESKIAVALKGLPLVGWIFKGMETMLGKPLLWVGSRLLRGIGDGIKFVFPELETLGSRMGTRIIGPFRDIPGRAGAIVRRMGVLIGGELATTARAAGAEAGRIGGRIIDVLDNFIARAGSVALRIANRIISPLADLAGRIVGPIARVGQTIIRALGGFLRAVGSQGYKLGRAIMEGIANGLSSLVSWLEGKIGGIAGGLLDKAKGILHISSPSKRFADEVGKAIMTGIALGIDRHQHRPSDALGRALTGTVGAGRGMVVAPAGGGGRVAQVNLVLDGRVLASTLVELDKNYRRQNAGRPLLSGK